MSPIELSTRQQQIVDIVKENGPITGEHIAERLSLTRATLRPDLAILTMAGFLDARPRVGYFYTGKSESPVLADKLQEIKVHHYQSRPVLIEQSASVYEAICTMFLEDVGTLFIVDSHATLVGVASRKDLLRASMGGQSIESIPVSVIMTRMPNITMCEKDDSVIEVAQKLISRQIDGLPIVKKVDAGSGFEVVGRITKTNITQLLVDLASKDGM
ncbi:helix-turn-helix transcriptional regulator [Shouchella clausii]|uniref:Transcriptional repressor CcpN n=1 Tax=Shouchella clausii TaxID=79880 RepID=A0A268S560_SHOCL|nr:helix-turn-helix transcriptional regulator [Shouchella clausii]PAD43594.1 transcriptional repressor CcpN [Bacillus sp. 7520-S]SPU22021.1 transcriptional regulator [Niallia circulans]AST98085.1 transcriptional repressor CcpN [Shouchella clausii]MBU8595370.1 helix-turn-helix transcriptional regulator [Shouchella clausii]MCM3550666.1 helix-turn-helix transcriptional regulator [Shouchella clausii]